MFFDSQKKGAFKNSNNKKNAQSGRNLNVFTCGDTSCFSLRLLSETEKLFCRLFLDPTFSISLQPCSLPAVIFSQVRARVCMCDGACVCFNFNIRLLTCTSELFSILKETVFKFSLPHARF